jgi:hypothetical protein
MFTTISSSIKGKGPRETKSVTPVVGGWVRGQKTTGVSFFSDIFYGVFLTPLTEKRPKT